MFSFSYPAVFRPEPDGRFTVSFPDLRGANTDGKDKQEATEEAIDCLGSYIAEAIATKRPIPTPSALKRGQRLVPVPFWIAGKLALFRHASPRHLEQRAGAAPRRPRDHRPP